MSQGTCADFRRIGELLVDSGSLTPVELAEALTRQAEARARGEDVRLGVLLVQLGRVEPRRVVDMLGRQGKTLLVCAACGESWNLRGVPESAPSCPHCGGKLRPPGTGSELRRALAAVGTWQQEPPSDAPSAVRNTQRGGPLRAESRPEPGSRFGRYRLDRVLGEGGMGLVWQAFDLELGRPVALKWIRESYDAPTARERFEREAAACAKLRHPHIVPVIDVGEIDGRRFLTMEYVEGRSFSGRLEEVREGRRAGAPYDAERLRDDITLLAEVASAAACAHAQGVVHRDLKPANVLIDEKGRAHVTDFGLAKDMTAAPGPALTRDGTALGSPCYMSPEQACAERERMGPATDVWALGVMLYEILTGETPFERAGVFSEVMRAAVEEEPDRPRARNAHAPADLEAVALRAIEKEPNARYPTAVEFESELRAWLRGEPVKARRRTFVERARRSMRRRAAALAAVALIVAGVGAVVGWGMHAKRLAHERTRVLFGQVGAAVEAFEDSVMRTRVPSEARAALAGQPLALLDALTENDPGSGSARAWRAQLYVLLGREAEADAEFDRAVAAAPEDPRPRFLRGSCALARYGTMRGLPGSYTSTSGIRFEPLHPESSAEAGLRARGLADLDAALARGAGLEDAEARIARALAAVYGQRPEGYAEALALLAKVDRPSAGRLRGLAHYHRGESAAAAADFSRALQAWPEDLVSRHGRGLAQLAIGLERASRGGDAVGAYAEAIADFDVLVDRRPDRADDWACRGLARTMLGEAEARRGIDPRDRFQAANEDYAAALARAPGLSDPYGNRAITLLDFAEADQTRGVDPRPRLIAGLQDSESALRLGPVTARRRGVRAVLLLRLAAAAMARTADARAEFTQAIDEYDAALALDPGFVEGYDQRGMARRGRAIAEARLGADPRAEIRRAIVDHDEAVRLDPEFGGLRNSRGVAWLELAQAESARGADPRESLQRAGADFAEALRLDPENFESWNNRGQARAALAAALAATGGDPRDELRRAVGDFDEMLKHFPDHFAAYCNRGRVYRMLGEAEAARGGDPRPACRLGMADLDAAVRVNPGAAESYVNRALTRQGIAAADALEGKDPRPELRAAIADLEEAVTRDPGEPANLLNRGHARLQLGEAEALRGVDPRPTLESALNDLAAVLAATPSSADAHMNRAAVWIRLADARKQRGGDVAAALRGAVEAADDALRLRPDLLGGYNNRGVARHDLGNLEAQAGRDPREEYRLAIADFGEAVRLRPDIPDALNNRGSVRLSNAEAEVARAGDPAPSYREAEEDFRAAIARHDVNARFNLGICLRAQGRAEEAVAAWDEAALAAPAYANWVAAHVQETLTKLRPWEARLSLAASSRQAGDGAAERTHLEVALGWIERWHTLIEVAEWDRALAPGQSLRDALGAAHWRLACLLARVSVDGAFAHLTAAAALGQGGAARLDAEPDLAPLHGDPRWEALRK